jgi:hypothetical protein
MAFKLLKTQLWSQSFMLSFFVSSTLIRFSSYWLVGLAAFYLLRSKLVISKGILRFFLILLSISFFQIFILPVGTDHLKNTLNLLGFILLTSYAYTRFTSLNFKLLFCRNLLRFTLLYIVVSVVLMGPLSFLTSHQNYTFNVINYYLDIPFFEKQLISQALTLAFFYVFAKKNKSILLWISLLLIIILVSGSRACSIGIFIVMLIGNSRINLSLNLAFWGFTIFVAFWIFVMQFSSSELKSILNFDVRFAYANAAYSIFLDNYKLGVGIFNVPYFMEEKQGFFLLNFGHLYDFGANKQFGYAFDSGFLNLLVGAGASSFLIIHQIGLVLKRYAKKNGTDFIYKTCLAIFISSGFEDNLLQPSFFILLALLTGRDIVMTGQVLLQKSKL